jgi:signal transduction histidine kinase
MSDIRSASILIVDDEVAHMKALCDTLQGHGYQIAGFSTPAAALAEIQAGRFDVLLTDLMMPEMDGIALLEAARRKDTYLAGIIMTGEGTIATAVEAMKSGAMDYILKPFKLRAVLPVLERALSVRRLRLENAALEQRVRERTAELEAANRELEAFSYSVSHDLRAPLRHIDGFTSILLEQHANAMPPEAQRLLGVVVGEARQMDRLIEDLLRFSRLGQQPLTKEWIEFAALFREVMNELQTEHAGRNVEISLGEVPDGEGDRSLLRQVVVNLLSNAFKFTRQREKATVEIGGRLQDQERLYFVRDNGAGFDMKYTRRLFGVFQRLHSTEEYEGTGVGLSIVQRIVVRHGGRIWAEAEVNKGATFYFTLPA